MITVREHQVRVVLVEAPKDAGDGGAVASRGRADADTEEHAVLHGGVGWGEGRGRGEGRGEGEGRGRVEGRSSRCRADADRGKHAVLRR